jgi:hypothetical protein
MAIIREDAILLVAEVIIGYYYILDTLKEDTRAVSLADWRPDRKDMLIRLEFAGGFQLIANDSYIVRIFDQKTMVVTICNEVFNRNIPSSDYPDTAGPIFRSDENSPGSIDSHSIGGDLYPIPQNVDSGYQGNVFSYDHTVFRDDGC